MSEVATIVGYAVISYFGLLAVLFLLCFPFYTAMQKSESNIFVLLSTFLITAIWILTIPLAILSRLVSKLDS